MTSECRARNTFVFAVFRQGTMLERRHELGLVLERLPDLRARLFIVSLLELLAHTVARISLVGQAGIITGHLEAHQPAWVGTMTFTRRRTMTTTLHHADGASWLTRGAGLDRDEIVDEWSESRGAREPAHGQE